MISPDVINISVVAGTLLMLLIYLFRFVIRYKHEYESNPLCTLAVLLCLCVVTTTTFLMPVDIYVLSIMKDQNNETMTEISHGLDLAYYSLYGIITLLIFVLIPFLHFFNEESESNLEDRLFSAVKYTFCFFMLAVFLLVIGFTIPVSETEAKSIITQLLDALKTTKFQQAITLVMSALTIAGLANVSLYTASGLFCWPIGLLMGTSSVAFSLERLNDREVSLRVKVNTLEEKQRAGRLTPSELEQLYDAQNELRELERDELVLSGYKETFAYKLRNIIRPVQIIIGILSGLLSLFLLVTLIMVSVDRLMHGESPQQGYILKKPVFINPLEYVLQNLQKFAIIGPLPILIITCYLVVVTISGIRNLGLWFLFARLHRIKIGRTQPQALLYMCVTIMLAVLAFNVFLFSLSGNYMTFGDQYGHKTDVQRCSLDNYTPACIPTRSSVFTLRMMSQFWFVGAVFYWWNWVFILIGVVSLTACLIRGKRKATHGIVSDEDEFED